LSIAIASLLALVIFGVLAVLVLGRVFRAAADRNENRPGGGEEEEGGRDPTGDDPGAEKARRSMTRSFGWGLAALGILLAGAGAVSAFDEVSLNNVVPAAFVGGVLGLAGYFMGARRIGATAVVVSVVVLMFGIGASQGLIPGMESTDRNLPATEPDAQRPSGEEPRPEDAGGG
jgi:hypothetical protein